MPDSFTVGDWRVIASTGQLIKEGTEHRLEPKAMAVLVYLSEHAGIIVSRKELDDYVWKDSVVTYEALTVIINKIRTALGDDSRNPQYIETLAKRGYRLIAATSFEQEVTEVVVTKPVRASGHAGERYWGVAVAVVLVALLAVFLFTREEVADDGQLQLPGPQELPTIAVLPFANISGDPSQDYFAYGITEYLITDLSRLSSLLVTSRSSVQAFNSRELDIQGVGQTLNVRYLLTGSVFKSKGQIRIAVQLTDSSNGLQLWADRFDRKLDDLFTVQDEIATRIVKELVKKVGHGKQELLSHNYTKNHEAYDFYLRGNALYTSISKEGNSLAREMFSKAVEVDPSFASAYGAIALTYVDDYRRKWGEAPEDAVERAFEYANKAIAIDSSAAVAYVVQAYAYLYGRKDPERAIRSAQQAIKLYPNYADAYAIIGSAYSFIGRSVDAIRVNHHAMRLNPTASSLYYANLGRDYYFLGRHEEAIDSLESAIFRNDNYLNAHLYLAATYADLNELDDAEWETEKLLTLDPGFSLSYWAETQPYRSAERLERMLDDLRRAGVPD